jgi:hypothetical protein
VRELQKTKQAKVKFLEEVFCLGGGRMAIDFGVLSCGIVIGWLLRAMRRRPEPRLLSGFTCVEAVRHQRTGKAEVI